MLRETAFETDSRLVYELFIRTTPEKLWKALTDPAETRLYDHGLAIDGEIRAGAPIRFLDPKGTPVCGGKVLEAKPGKRFVHTFAFAFTKDAPSRVTFEIRKAGKLVKLTVIHDRFGGETRTWKLVKDGWVETLSGLKTLLETGKPLVA